MEWSPQAQQPESNVENETSGLRKPVEDFLKSNGIDTEIFKPVVTLNTNGFLSVEIFKDGKSIFNGYQTSEPFRTGKEKIIEGAKEALGYWIEEQKSVMVDMKEIGAHTGAEIDKFVQTGQASEKYNKGNEEERNVA